MKKKFYIALMNILLCSFIHAQQTILFEDDNSVFANPERGWVESIFPTFNDGTAEVFAVQDLIDLREGTDKVTILRKYYQLKDYLNSDIPQSYLDIFEADLEACRQAGVKLIPRFVYVYRVNINPNDATLPIALGHIQQLEPLLQENSDVIAFMETGFVGNYGEWNSTANNYIDNFTNEILSDGFVLRDALLNALPQDRQIAMRYLYWHKIKLFPNSLTSVSAHNGSFQSRIGIHNDLVMLEPEWEAPGCGECPSYSSMRNYTELDQQWTVNFGEPGFSTNYAVTTDPRSVLEALHYTGLIRNAPDGTDYYDYWQTIGAYEDFSKKFGYRISINQLTTLEQVDSGNILPITINLENSGYAAPINKREIIFVLRNTANQNELTINTTQYNSIEGDMRFWQPNIEYDFTYNLEIPQNLDSGEYEILLKLADPYPILADRIEYNLRLSNLNVWEENTGFNNLNTIVQVNNTLNINDINEQSISIYPNPSKGTFFIDGLPDDCDLNLIDVNGKTLESLKLIQNRKIDISKYSNGLYFLKINCRENKIVKKLMIR